jgi:hypothetical protein
MPVATSEKPKNAPSDLPGTSTRAAGEPAGRRVALLAAGDALAFLIFAAIGRGSHGEATGLAALPQIALTALPFAAAWFILAPFAGAYRREVSAHPRQMLKRTALAWLLSWPLALALRGIFVDHAVPPLTFAGITLVFNMAILLIWRWPYAVLKGGLRKRFS